MKNEQGFSLIELMIVVAIIGIIAAYATTSYNDSVVKSKRADAKTSLMSIAARLERCYTMNGQYTTTATPARNCEVVDDTHQLIDATSADEYYDLSIALDTTTGSSYTLTATPVTGFVDPKCTSFTLTNTGVKGATGSDLNRCW